MNAHPTALIADDEPLLRDALRWQLANVWPELEIAAEARNGREAVRLFEEQHPDICFLDVHMPGLSGVDAANHIGRHAHLVFVTAYLRAAVPLLHESAATIDRELQLVRPYLELMQMRMPDRLRYAMNVDPSVLKVRCPPTTLLTLVENAVRHGIDPSEEGGRIDIDIARHGERCVVRVADTGAGLGQSANSLGTGLTTLRERLRLIFGEAAHLRLTPNDPRGAVVEIDMPAQTGAPDARNLRVGVEI